MHNNRCQKYPLFWDFGFHFIWKSVTSVIHSLTFWIYKSIKLGNEIKWTFYIILIRHFLNYLDLNAFFKNDHSSSRKETVRKHRKKMSWFILNRVSKMSVCRPNEAHKYVVGSAQHLKVKRSHKIQISIFSLKALQIHRIGSGFLAGAEWGLPTPHPTVN